ncbi:hypothetical protein MLD38_036346 [Melastoma candidum]|uniref:Uncharacterized protein n=1 Tax=Melastoma candidum TaxID=119954 RepID=A0ACB9LJL3_9MYRT|nr:hypothetical protein MLD38_036346 [Melastoma candidum]
MGSLAQPQPPSSFNIANGCNKHDGIPRVDTMRKEEFRMPLHYPRYTRSDYEKMPEWKLDRLLQEYGLPTVGDVEHKRKFAMGTFLWSN